MHIKKQSAKIVLTVVLVFGFITSPSLSHAATPNIEMWWPVEGARLAGSQPLQGLQKGAKVDDYKMFWQVDGGALVSMETSYVGYPHKRATVDFSNWKWNGSGPYRLTFKTKSLAGVDIAETTMNIYVDSVMKNPPVAVVAPASAPTPTPTPTPTILGSLSGKRLYVDTNSPAAAQAKLWSSTRPADALLMQKISTSPHPIWLGSWSSTADTVKRIKATMSAAGAVSALPTFVLYNIPYRDCGSYSAGGLKSPAEYNGWIDAIATALGKNPAIVILEPDALALTSCLSQSGQDERMLMLKNAVNTIKTRTGAFVYVDAGHSGWVSAKDMSERLKKVAIDKADGFALNVSNFGTTNLNTSYGKDISALTYNKRFVIDTSRNGLGSNGEWCNPSGRALGQRPTTSTNEPLVDAYLWLKVPGESDGTCNSGPSAGTWWSDHALGLAARANW